MGACEPVRLRSASAVTSEPFVTPVTASRAAAPAASARTGSSCTSWTVPWGMSGVPSRSSRSPRVGAVRSSARVSPGASSGCHGEPSPGPETTHPALSSRSRTGVSYRHSTSPGSVHATVSVAEALDPSRENLLASAATGAEPSALTAVAKSSGAPLSANGTPVRSRARQPST